MKKTLGLVGLFFVGLALLANPSTGILAPADDTATTMMAEPTTTISGDPPPHSTEDVLIVTTTAEVTSTTTDPTTANGSDQIAPSGTYSVAGSVESSRWGDFQVEAVFEDGVLVDVITLHLPNDRTSDSINDYAVPIYKEAVLEAQGTDIDVISGATITWIGYTNSLQSALDEAGFEA